MLSKFDQKWIKINHIGMQLATVAFLLILRQSTPDIIYHNKSVYLLVSSENSVRK